MPSNTTATFLGLDVHKNTISAGILRPGEEVPDVEEISSDEESVRLIGRLGNPRRLRARYEAGPTGYELARLLGSLGVACQVIAPALVPTAPGDRVKTESAAASSCAPLPGRPACRRPGAHRRRRSGERPLPCQGGHGGRPDQGPAPPGQVPAAAREGLAGRDSVGAQARRLDEGAALRGQATFAHYRATLEAREAAVGAIEADLAAWFTRPPFQDAVARLGAYRGTTHMGHCTWRRRPATGGASRPGARSWPSPGSRRASTRAASVRAAAT
jgi:transposase